MNLAFVLCAKRNESITLRNNFTYCELEKKKICGKGAYSYCLPPTEEECPISDIGFINSYEFNTLNKTSNTKYF